MAQAKKQMTDYNAEVLLEHYSDELTDIDCKLREHKRQIALLTSQRHKILAKIQDVDMDIVLQCITEKGLSSNEVLEIINQAVES